MDVLRESILQMIREVSNAGGSLIRGEVLIREGLMFVAAIIGALWGYFLGRSAERRRWGAELQPALEALHRAFQNSANRVAR